jgi:hypothetical protein
MTTDPGSSDSARPGEPRHFHLVMAVLLIASSGIDQQDLAGWRSGRVSVVTLGLALVWLGRYAMDGFSRRDARARILGNRVKDLEERMDDLDRAERARRAPFS